MDSLPGTDAYVGRLLQNYEDMEEALAPYYGEDAAEEFGDLVASTAVASGGADGVP